MCRARVSIRVMARGGDYFSQLVIISDCYSKGWPGFGEGTLNTRVVRVRVMVRVKVKVRVRVSVRVGSRLELDLPVRLYLGSGSGLGLGLG